MWLAVARSLGNRSAKQCRECAHRILHPGNYKASV